MDLYLLLVPGINQIADLLPDLDVTIHEPDYVGGYYIEGSPKDLDTIVDTFRGGQLVQAIYL